MQKKRHTERGPTTQDEFLVLFLTPNPCHIRLAKPLAKVFEVGGKLGHLVFGSVWRGTAKPL